jgi:succinyl-CoA---D-citramalate CoA-transferase
VFRRLCGVMQRPDLADSADYATHTARGRNQKELDDIIAAWTKTLAADELDALLAKNGIPAGQIYRAPEMIDDPHFQARKAIVRVPHADFGDLAMQNVFPVLSETPGTVRHVGPRLGEHNEQIFGGLLGLDAGRIASLHSAGVI